MRPSAPARPQPRGPHLPSWIDTAPHVHAGHRAPATRAVPCDRTSRTARRSRSASALDNGRAPVDLGTRLAICAAGACPIGVTRQIQCVAPPAAFADMEHGEIAPAAGARTNSRRAIAMELEPLKTGDVACNKQIATMIRTAELQHHRLVLRRDQIHTVLADLGDPLLLGHVITHDRASAAAAMTASTGQPSCRQFDRCTSIAMRSAPIENVSHSVRTLSSCPSADEGCP